MLFGIALNSSCRASFLNFLGELHVLEIKKLQESFNSKMLNYVISITGVTLRKKCIGAIHQ